MLEKNSWSGRVRQRLSRRSLLRSAGGAAAAAGLAACSRGGQSAPSGASGTSGAAKAPSGAPKPGGTFNSYLTANPQLDVQKAAVVLQAVACVYSRPFRFKTATDPTVSLNHEIEPELAVSAESSDAITWTLKLRPDAKFQNIAPVNGHPVEAEDVKDSILRILDPKTLSQFKNNYAMIDPAQMQTPDAHTIVFKLKYPFAPFPNLLASPSWAYIYPREATAGAYDPTKTVIGSGPFMIDSYTPDVAITFKRNPDYFEKGVPNVDAMKLAIVPNSAQQQAQFTAKNLDEILLASISDVDSVSKQAPAAAVIKASNTSPNPFYFQLGDPSGPMQDIRVRQAFSMAIDRESFGKAIYAGQYQEVVFIPGYMGKWAMQVSDLPADIQQYYKYNPGEVKKLLDAAGQSNLTIRFFQITGGAFGSDIYKSSFQTINNMLNQAGIKTTVVPVDFFQQYVDSGHGLAAGNYAKDEMLWGGIPGYTDADDFLFNELDSTGGTNQVNLKDPALDAMINHERTLIHEDERLKAVQDIQKHIAQKLYMPSTVGTFQWALTQPRVQNYQYSSTNGRLDETYPKLWLNG